MLYQTLAGDRCELVSLELIVSVRRARVPVCPFFLPVSFSLSLCLFAFLTIFSLPSISPRPHFFRLVRHHLSSILSAKNFHKRRFITLHYINRKTIYCTYAIKNKKAVICAFYLGTAPSVGNKLIVSNQCCKILFINNTKPNVEPETSAF